MGGLAWRVEVEARMNVSPIWIYSVEEAHTYETIFMPFNDLTIALMPMAEKMPFSRGCLRDNAPRITRFEA